MPRTGLGAGHACVEGVSEVGTRSTAQRLAVPDSSPDGERSFDRRPASAAAAR